MQGRLKERNLLILKLWFSNDVSIPLANTYTSQKNTNFNNYYFKMSINISVLFSCIINNIFIIFSLRNVYSTKYTIL